MNNASHKNTREAVEIAIRLSLLILIVYWCFQILSPFIMPVLWGIIIAVAIFPVFNYIQQKLGGRKKLTAILVTTLLLAVIFVPAGFFFGLMIDNIILLKNQYEAGTLQISKPSASIQSWPFIGTYLYHFLTHFTENIQQLFSKYQSQILSAGRVILNSIIGTGLTVFQIIFSVIIAGILLATKGTTDASEKIFARLIGDKGNDYLQLTVSTPSEVLLKVFWVWP